MRVCIKKLTGKLIEAQSGGETQEHLDTLLQNAINAGYKPEDVEVKFVTDEDFEAIPRAKAIPTEEQINEEKIQTRMRELAIESLKASKELPADFGTKK